MFLQKPNISLNEFLTPGEICDIIQLQYHPQIESACTSINVFLAQNPLINELPVSVSEMVQLLFSKLQDDIKHLCLKEKVILLPYIKSISKNKEIITGYTETEKNILTVIADTQKLIITTAEKIRVLLNDYFIQREWSAEFKHCVTDMKCLETKILEWITVEHHFLYPKVIANTNINFN